MTNIPFKQAHSGNYLPAQRTAQDIRYLVIHFTANDGDTAKNNADYFAGNEVTASAHFFVDENEIWQSVREKDIAWHCGTRGTYFHPYCRNANSLGIELCSRMRDGRYYFMPATLDRAAGLARRLMAQYGIPVEQVVRHYDVTHKICPAPLVEDSAGWQAFLDRLQKGDDDMTADEVRKLIEQSRTIYRTAAEVPVWGSDTVSKLTQKGYLRGEDGEAGLNLSEDLLRALVINDRAGIYGD